MTKLSTHMEGRTETCFGRTVETHECDWMFESINHNSSWKSDEPILDLFGNGESVSRKQVWKRTCKGMMSQNFEHVLNA